MNTKNNKRHQETIRRIETAFLSQVREKPISQIKVSDICQDAQINRSTFYANYCDIYALADAIHLRLKEDVTRIIQQDLGQAFSENHFLQIFQHIQANQELYYFYFKLGLDKDTDHLFLHSFSPAPCAKDNAKLDYHIVFFKNGFNGILQKWLENGCTESPEQMRDVLLREYQGRWGASGVPQHPIPIVSPETEQ